MISETRIRVASARLSRIRDIREVSGMRALCHIGSIPRKARIDAVGGFHHLIIRAIERKKIFQDNGDKDNFLDRLGAIPIESSRPF